MPLFTKKPQPEVQVDFQDLPRHIAIIMDGNGRWAKKRGLPRSAGHAAGAETFRTIATYCKEIGLEYLTVYAFSTENWKRPKEEVDALMNLFRTYLKRRRKPCSSAAWPCVCSATCRRCRRISARRYGRWTGSPTGWDRMPRPPPCASTTADGTRSKRGPRDCAGGQKRHARAGGDHRGDYRCAPVHCAYA